MGRSENTDQQEQKRCPSNMVLGSLKGKMQGVGGGGYRGPGLCHALLAMSTEPFTIHSCSWTERMASARLNS